MIKAKRWLVFLFFLTAVPLFSPAENIDSLKKVLSDTNRVNHPDKQLIKAAIYVSDYYSRKRLDSAKYYGKLAYQMSKITGNKTAIAVSLNAIGMTYTSAAYYDSAAPYLDSALKMFEVLGDSTGITFVKNNMAVVAMRKGDYIKAIEYYHENLKQATRQNNYENMLLNYNNLGIAYFDWKKYDEALESYEKALKVLDEKGEEERKGSVYNNIGEIYREWGQPEKAKEYFEKSLIINKKYGKQRSILVSISSLGEIYYDNGEYKKALRNFKEALNISKDIPDDYHIAEMSVKVGKVLNHLGQIEKAQQYLDTAIFIASDLGIKNVLLEAYENMMENAKLTGNTKQLYDYSQKYIALKDSIFNEESLKTVNELDARYKTAQKEKEIALLTADRKAKELEIQVQKNQKYFLIITLLLILFVAYLFFNRYRIKQFKIKSELEKAKISIEQRLLRSQMNPHFIFNSLNSINSFIRANNPQEAQKYLTKFARLMRLILENSRKTSIPLEDEIQALKLNLELEKLRFENRFDFEIQVADDIDPEFTYISPMLIQPFVENAVKHGFKDLNHKGKITIRFKKEGNLLVCEVEDNGMGREAAGKAKSATQHVSLGTQVTKERFSALQLENEEAGFEIIDLYDEKGKPAGTKVIIKIPFEEE